MTETMAPINPALHNVPEYSVSDIAGAVKRMVEERFGHVRVRGEISGWRGPHSSGHAYFRLKDDKAVLEAVCWRGTLSKLGCRPEEGLEVVVTGRITTYPGKSSYQIVVESMEPAGVGALMALLEKRKAQLAAEGLFQESRKKALPYLPTTIGVITSPTGAVIRDILHRIADRFPCRVLVWPVAVQGAGAAEQIAEAIRGFNALNDTPSIPRPDVLIVARGGGSIEDLWAFNEEIVVRAVAASHIPLISAVGHETDTTLIDFASDRRAPTPTASAEMAVPVREELLLVASQLGVRLQAGTTRFLQQKQSAVEGLTRGLPRPDVLLEHTMQRLDDWSERLRNALPALLTMKEQRVFTVAARLTPQIVIKDMRLLATRLDPLNYLLNQAMLRRLDREAQRIDQWAALLATLDSSNVLKRGFVIVKDATGRVIASAEAAAQAQPVLSLQFHDGDVQVKKA